ncbi:A-kinase anchor protein 10, mitochondrial isoform X2 [Frieseomelitta varia]|uniref:A-kinase anchor protein 10, mitochondrial isoform X2 n=1 Tax=Frieseomelitta varia TaxID=561572 RepID=UPI001CB68125|nr:A-kinase anchor protein 10, mitochondrial isoform X2 [Frieseomelitta varia]
MQSDYDLNTETLLYICELLSHGARTGSRERRVVGVTENNNEVRIVSTVNGQKDRPRSLQTSPAKSTSSGRSFGDVFGNDSSTQAPAGALCSLEEEEEDEFLNGEARETCSFNSQLSKTLPQILADKGALGYFIQFMETQNCIALIKFWLEVECLCSSFNVLENKVENVECLNCVRSTSSIANSVNNNDNFQCDTAQNNVDSHESKELLLDEYVNSNDMKSNCNDMPKTSQTISKMRQSNHDCKRKDMTTIRQDVLRIHKKYITKDTLGTSQIPEDLQVKMEKVLNCENIEPMLQCLSAVQNIVYQTLENEHINDFLRSEFHCKHQIDVLTSGNVQLADILYNETAFFYFMEFMELENKRELLDFWMSAMSYKQNLLEKKGAANPEEAQADALIIYDKYFSLQATMPLGFSDKIRFQVEQNICRENGEGPEPDCFDKPCRIVYNFLILSTYFLIISVILQILIRINRYYTKQSMFKFTSQAKKSSSEVSSVSINMQNTLQAGSEGNRLNNNKNITSGMNIDTRQLYDPDSLWKRNKYSLSVGYIDNLGRFITEIEPDPQRKYESRLTRAVKRLVNMEQDKAKEELAWKIAEMIIREITSLTLGTSNFPS